MAKKEANSIKHWMVKLESLFNGGYTTLKYITMKNGAYIKLDYSGTTGYMYEGEASFDANPSTSLSASSISTWPMIVSRYNPVASGNLLLCQDQTYFKTRFQFVSNNMTLKSSTGESHKYRTEYKSGAGKLYMDGAFVYGADTSTYSTASVADSYICLGKNSVSTTLTGVQCIYDVDGNLVRKLTPSMRRSDGVYGLLDNITGTFYYNANTSTSSYIEGGGRIIIE